MITIDSLKFKYADGTVALHDINLRLNKGEIMALTGSNGCGKTTLLKHMIGLLKPTSGRVLLNEKDLYHIRPEDVYRQVGIVFQDPNDQLFAATVEQDVAIGVTNLGLKLDECNLRIKQALKMVNAVELSSKTIQSLSYGQKRRVAIAGVLAMEPQIMLLDEPTSGLDPLGVNDIMRLLHKLNRENGVSMVIATHDVDMVPLFCDTVAIMNRGKITTIGKPGQVFGDINLLRKSGMRLPRIAHLFEILNKQDSLDITELPLTISAARRELRNLIVKNSIEQAVHSK
jgi:cobalt/nickel transport system ATP-binding protein